MGRARVEVIAVVAILITALAVIGFTTDTGNTPREKASANSTTSTTVRVGEHPQAIIVSQATIASLTVKTISVSCGPAVSHEGGKLTGWMGRTIVPYDIGALKGVPPRKWSDALSTPLQGGNSKQWLASLQGAVCQDPLLGSTVANFFANMSVGRISVLRLNPWLLSFAGSASSIHTNATRTVTPLLDVKKPTQAQALDAVKRNLEWQSVAEKLDTLLTRFHVGAVVRSERSVLNYHLLGGGLVVGGLPEVGLNPNQESLPALGLDLTEKGICAPIKKIGFNLGDKRPELFATPVCMVPTFKSIPPGSTPSTTASTTGIPTTTPPSSPTTSPPTTKPTVPPTTGPKCPSGKCVPPTTVPAPPTTRPTPSTTTTQPTTVPPTTQAPPSPPPSTSAPPTTTPPPPGV